MVLEDAGTELSDLLRTLCASRLALVVASRDVNMNENQDSNSIYILELEKGSAAGGRGGGFGQRTARRVGKYGVVRDSWNRMLDVAGAEQLEGFELPYHAAAMPVVLQGGDELMVAGVVDDALVKEYDSRFGISKSPDNG